MQSSNYYLCDAHCHLDLPAFADDWSSQVNDAVAAGVKCMVIAGSHPRSFKQALNIHQHFPKATRLSVGLHPYFLGASAADDFQTVIDLSQSHRENIVAIGETGLDRQLSDIARQQQVFAQHITLANQLKLPLIIHHRQSHDLIFQQLKRQPAHYGGMVHSFSGSQQDAQRYIDLGFYLGFGGVLSYPRAQKTRQTFSLLPQQWLLLESDAPDSPHLGRQGQRNLPLYLAQLLTIAAELRGVSELELSQVTWQNSQRLFGPMPL